MREFGKLMSTLLACGYPGVHASFSLHRATSGICVCVFVCRRLHVHVRIMHMGQAHTCTCIYIRICAYNVRDTCNILLPRACAGVE